MDKIKRTRRTKLQMQEARRNESRDYLLEDIVLEIKRPTDAKTQTGWLNIYYNTSPSGKCWYSTGGDIYDSVESARTHAQKGVLSQVQITYPLKRED